MRPPNYLLTTRVSEAAAKRMLLEVAHGVYQLETFGSDDVAQALEVLDRYPGLNLGIADASLVVLADRYGARDILTLDERHFRTLRDGRGRAFRILPADLTDEPDRVVADGENKVDPFVSRAAARVLERTEW